MVRTRVGYAGGTKKNPTYNDLGNHSETVQIDYDPTRISYKDLLDIFWDSHSATMPSFSLQYRSVIFYHNEEQKNLAVESKEREEARLKGKIYTEIVPASDFYLAEAYHQKYQLQHVPALMREFNAMYHDSDGFVNSTTAARINGYIAGYGTPETLQEELNSYGLSDAGKEKLLEIARK